MDCEALVTTFLFWAVCLLGLGGERAASITCRDEDGSPIDWFVAIKVPRLRKLHSDGTQYLLITSKQKAWRKSSFQVTQKNGAIYNTAKQAYDALHNDSVVSIMYNDEHPENNLWRPSRTLFWSHESGHMKGVLSFEAGKSGFWLINSVPKFPGIDNYLYPHSGTRYGQHFFCISFEFSQLETIAKQLLIASPSVFQYNLPTSIGEKIPDLKTVVSNSRTVSTAKSSVVNLLSSSKQPFLHFSKSAYFEKDLYASLVAPGLKTNLLFEGWVLGGNHFPSECKFPYRVYNINKVSLKNYDWKTTQDHSKWAVSCSGSKPWVCLCDINREHGQLKRGGGAMCISDPVLWKLFSTMVVGYDQCPSFASQFDHL